MRRTPPKRASKGSISGYILIGFPADLRKRLDAAAKKEGLSMAEWVRQAIAALLPPG